MEFIAAPGLAAAGLLRGLKNSRNPLFYTLAGHWLVGAPIGLLLSVAGTPGIVGVWVGRAIGTAATGALMLTRLKRRRQSG